MSRIMICGLNGSGKTTLGKALAEELGYLNKDIEEYYFDEKNEYKYDKPLDKESVIKGSNVRVQYDGGIRSNKQLLKENNGKEVVINGCR